LNNNGTPNTNIMGGDMSLAADFFQPQIVAIPGEVAANLKYLASDLAQNVDEQTVDGLRNALFPDAPILDNVEVGASDLIADDIQRGRDEGDPTYNAARIQMGEKPVTSFAQITSNVQLQNELKQVYGNVNNVELFVGLMAEDHLPGSSLGPTEQAILAQQFQALRDGDRYFYLNADSPQLINQLNNTTLSKIIQRNTGLTNLQSDVFLFRAGISGNVSNGFFGPGGFGNGGFNSPNNFGGGSGGFGGGQNGQGLAGLTVNLIDDEGNIVATTTTDFRGNYSFNVTGTGQFQVQLVTANQQTVSKNVLISSGDQFIHNLNFQLQLGLGGHGWGSSGSFWETFDGTCDNWS